MVAVISLVQLAPNARSQKAHIRLGYIKSCLEPSYMEQPQVE